MQEIKKLAVVGVLGAVGLSSCISVTVERNKKQPESSYNAAARQDLTEQAQVAPIPPEKEKVLVEHTIVAGDSLWKIANDYGTTIKEIQEANGMTDANIFAGKKIMVPTDQPPAPPENANSAPMIGDAPLIPAPVSDPF